MARRLREIRALEVALALEVLWAAFLVYEIHWQRWSMSSLPWDEQVRFFAKLWAAPAIAILVIVWLVRAAWP